MILLFFGTAPAPAAVVLIVEAAEIVLTVEAIE